MKNAVRYFLLASLLCCVGFNVGCKKKQAAGPASATSSTLPGASDVMSALDKKDYDAAIAALMKVRQGVTSAEQDTQFTVLVHEVKQKLLDAPDDPKAVQALATLRGMTVGR